MRLCACGKEKKEGRGGGALIGGKARLNVENLEPRGFKENDSATLESHLAHYYNAARLTTNVFVYWQKLVFAGPATSEDWCNEEPQSTRTIS